MSQAYILTEEGRAYTQEGVDFVLDLIRNKFKDHSEVTLSQGMLYNTPSVLSKALYKNTNTSYVFVSHDKGIETLHDTEDIKRFIALLEDPNNAHKTSWSIIMKALELL